MPGLGDVRITLYDVFGYLLPGLVTFAAVSIFVWALVFPRAALTTPHLNGPEWIAVVVAAYVLGHLVQAVADWIIEQPGLQPQGRKALEWVPLEKKIARKVHEPAPEDNATDAKKDEWARKIYELCDIVVSQKGQTGDREIYQYREGFYRGLSVALVLTLVAVIVRGLVSGDAIVGKHHAITGGEYFLVCAVLAAAAFLSWQRFLHFFALKWHNAVWSFAVVAGMIGFPKRDS